MDGLTAWEHVPSRGDTAKAQENEATGRFGRVGRSRERESRPAQKEPPPGSLGLFFRTGLTFYSADRPNRPIAIPHLDGLDGWRKKKSIGAGESAGDRFLRQCLLLCKKQSKPSKTDHR